jgi:D-glycero-beta-D-manno-heptose 1-phosphate adenylyltransferase
MSANYLDFIQKKIVLGEKLASLISTLKFQNKTIVFTNGVFDLLHPGHMHYLAEAKALGDLLIVGLNADSSARQLGKGSARPLQSEEARSLNLAALLVVDYIVLFNEPTPKALIEVVLPNVLVKGGDYEKEKIVGYDTVIANGGKVQVLKFLEGYSTTAIELKIKNG